MRFVADSLRFPFREAGVRGNVSRRQIIHEIRVCESKWPKYEILTTHPTNDELGGYSVTVFLSLGKFVPLEEEAIERVSTFPTRR